MLDMARKRSQPTRPWRRPGFDGKRELEAGTAENPYVKGEHELVIRNIRESTLTTMHARGQIDDAQLRAGEWFRATYERMRMSNMAIDPSHEPVDTSGISDPIPDRVLLAGQALAAAARELGRNFGYPIVEMVCGQGMTIGEAARRVNGGFASRLTEKYFGRLLRNALDVLAAWRGYATKGT